MGGRNGHYGYHEYRGRGGGRGRTVLLFIIALLVVLLLAGVLFMVFIGPYLEYSPTGLKINWPWAQEEPPAPSPPPIASDLLEVVSDPPPDLIVESTEPTPSPKPEYTPIGVVTVTAAQLRNGTAAQTAAAAGGGAVVVEMKDIKGRLAWQSQVELAATLGTNAADNLTAQAVQTLSQTTDLYLVARVQCFRDPILAQRWVGTLMTKGGNLWHDAQGVGWTSPASQQTVDYLSALCLELADMGFDEILLDSAGYPNSGEVNVLAVGDNRPEDLTVPVSAFLSRLSEELEERGVRLSVYTDETLATGSAVLSGLTARVLAQYADRVWLSSQASAQQYTTLLTAEGWENLSARLVVKNADVGSWYQ